MTPSSENEHAKRVEKLRSMLGPLAEAAVERHEREAGIFGQPHTHTTSVPGCRRCYFIGPEPMEPPT